MGVIRSIAGMFRRNPHAGPAAHLYNLAVARARAPVFYAALAVPDTPDGRFEMIALHVHLICRRLTAEGAAGGALAQALFDRMFADMDRNLREMGVGDLAVGKRIKRMAQDYFGRAGAVEAGLQTPDDALADALRRNIYSGTSPADEQVEAFAGYIRSASDALQAQPAAAIAGAGESENLFGPQPADGPAR